MNVDPKLFNQFITTELDTLIRRETARLRLWMPHGDFSALEEIRQAVAFALWRAPSLFVEEPSIEETETLPLIRKYARRQIRYKILDFFRQERRRRKRALYYSDLRSSTTSFDNDENDTYFEPYSDPSQPNPRDCATINEFAHFFRSVYRCLADADPIAADCFEGRFMLGESAKETQARLGLESDKKIYPMVRRFINRLRAQLAQDLENLTPEQLYWFLIDHFALSLVT